MRLYPQISQIAWGDQAATKIYHAKTQRRKEEKFATESTEDTEKLRFNSHKKAQKAQKKGYSSQIADKWQQTAISLETTAKLKDQPRGIQLEYRVKAINKAGQSEPSNTIAVVL